MFSWCVRLAVRVGEKSKITGKRSRLPPAREVRGAPLPLACFLARFVCLDCSLLPFSRHCRLQSRPMLLALTLMVLVGLRTVLKMDSQYLFGSTISDDAEAAT